MRLTGVFLWMAPLFLPRHCLEWIVEAVALRTAASDKPCVNTMCVTWGLSVHACVCKCVCVCVHSMAVRILLKL